MKKIVLILLALVCSNVFLYSQNEVLRKSLKNDTIEKTKGPNRKYFSHFYLDYGQILGDPSNAESDIVPGFSYDFSLGYRKKIKISNFYSFGYEITLNKTSYRLRQSYSKNVPNNFSNEKEKLIVYSTGLGLYDRFNFGKRGDFIGKFLDLGAYADYNIYEVHYTKNVLPNDNVIKSRIYNLRYFNELSYGVFARIGNNRYALYAKYRLSDLFEKSYSYTELPRIIIGGQIGFHK